VPSLTSTADNYEKVRRNDFEKVRTNDYEKVTMTAMNRYVQCTRIDHFD